MRVFTTILLLTVSITGVFAQDSGIPDGIEIDTTKPNPWQLKAIYGLNGTQTSFVNWNAGGRNNLSVLGFISASADYITEEFKWDNEFGLALGGLQYLGEGTAAAKTFQKTDDRIEYSSNVGYRMTDELNLSFISGFRTQMLDGFNYPNDSLRTSNFMAPGYLNLGLGLDYTPNKRFTAFLSPLAAKMTFVQDETLANQGAFGVEGAEYDGNGEISTPGEQFRFEVGAYVKFKYTQKVAENIDLKSKIELFSNYLYKPKNVDVNAEVLWSFKVNSWFSASLQWNLIYDDDIRILDINGDTGPRTQFKSVLGLGISYTMKNFDDKKK
jgi:hypothetical protein